MTPRGATTMDALHQIAWAGTLDRVWAILTDAMADRGFELLLYAATRFRTSGAIGDASDALILSNWPREQLDPYVNGGMFKDAPLVRWAAANAGVRSWRSVAEEAAAGHLGAPEARVVAFHAAAGMRAGYVVSFQRSLQRDGYGLGLATRKRSQDEADAIWAEHGREIEVLASVAHLKLMALPHGDHVRALTVRQREVLELVADGKTIQDVAILIGRNPATVEKHLRLARDALGVETTAQAILKMGLHNRFFTLPGSEPAKR